VRIAALKREEDGLGRERERLEAEKMRHIRHPPIPPLLLPACAPWRPAGSTEGM
jgi:hypothetical protein